MFTGNFSPTENVLLVSSGVIFIAAILSFHYTSKINLSVLLLLTGAFILKLFHIHIDPFLNNWDEMFHALVAKNMSHHPFKPTLYPEALRVYDFREWTNNYIWLHKQPLFMWQMAICIKLIGAKVIAVRLPSVVCFTFATFCIYRIGKNLANQSIGFYAALLFSVSYFMGELAVGAETTDHNDLVFISYVTASIWAFTEYQRDDSNKTRWIVLIGIFAGMAVLTKWLVGLLVYLLWASYVAFDSGKNFYHPKRYLDLFKSFAITCIVFLPWQIYIRVVFPAESHYEADYNNRHLYEPIEGHSGDGWFHLDKINEMYGYLAPFFCLLGLVILYRYIRSKAIYFSLLFTMVFVFGFFAWASTKMISFTMITSSFLYIGFGAVVFALHEFLIQSKLKQLRPILFITLIFTMYSSLKLDALEEKHGLVKKSPYAYHTRRVELDWKNSCDQINAILDKKEKYVVFNCPEYMQNIRFMFYTDHIGYRGFPDPEHIRQLKRKGYKVMLFDNADLPAEVYNNKEVGIITLPKFKVTALDTVFIRPKNYEYLVHEWGGRILCNKKDAKTRMIIKTFADGSSQILLPEGDMATLDYNNKDNIVFNRRQFLPTERFILQKVDQMERKDGGIYTIRTADDVPVKVVEKGDNIRATNGPGENLFEISLERKVNGVN